MLARVPSCLINLLHTHVASHRGEAPPLVVDLQAAHGDEAGDHHQQESDQEDLPPGDALRGPGAYVIQVVFFMGRGL